MEFQRSEAQAQTIMFGSFGMSDSGSVCHVDPLGSVAQAQTNILDPLGSMALVSMLCGPFGAVTESTVCASGNAHILGMLFFMPTLEAVGGSFGSNHSAGFPAS